MKKRWVAFNIFYNYNEYLILNYIYNYLCRTSSTLQKHWIFMKMNQSISPFSRNLTHQFPHFPGISTIINFPIFVEIHLNFPIFQEFVNFPIFQEFDSNWYRFFISISLFSRNLYMINFLIFQEFHFGSIHGNSWNKIYLISYKI